MDGGRHATGVRKSLTFSVRVQVQAARLNTQLPKAIGAKHF